MIQISVIRKEFFLKDKKRKLKVDVEVNLLVFMNLNFNFKWIFNGFDKFEFQLYIKIDIKLPNIWNISRIFWTIEENFCWKYQKLSILWHNFILNPKTFSKLYSLMNFSFKLFSLHELKTENNALTWFFLTKLFKKWMPFQGASLKMIFSFSFTNETLMQLMGSWKKWSTQMIHDLFAAHNHSLYLSLRGKERLATNLDKSQWWRWSVAGAYGLKLYDLRWQFLVCVTFCRRHERPREMCVDFIINYDYCSHELLCFWMHAESPIATAWYFHYSFFFV